ncbi:hypothetical protein EMCG_05597, partial [[Emmonsia] crescens]
IELLHIEVQELTISIHQSDKYINTVNIDIFHSDENAQSSEKIEKNSDNINEQLNTQIFTDLNYKNESISSISSILSTLNSTSELMSESISTDININTHSVVIAN